MNYRYIFPFIIFFIISCGEKNKQAGSHQAQISNDTIPAVRKSVSKKTVASFIIPMGDPKLDRKFGVEIYETPETFKYLMVMYNDGTIQNDTLVIPNFGTWPAVKVKPGEEKLSCIIGFLDNKNEFMEFKKLYIKNNELKLIILKRYAVATYYK